MFLLTSQESVECVIARVRYTNAADYRILSRGESGANVGSRLSSNEMRDGTDYSRSERKHLDGDYMAQVEFVLFWSLIESGTCVDEIIRNERLSKEKE